MKGWAVKLEDGSPTSDLLFKTLVKVQGISDTRETEGIHRTIGMVILPYGYSNDTSVSRKCGEIRVVELSDY
jgi:hypothetical protein